MARRRGDVRRVDPIEWLGTTTQIGDLILIGDRGVVGRVIQAGTGSRFSHAAVVIGDDKIIEAYDYGLLPSPIKAKVKAGYRDYTDGVSVMSFAKMVGRSKSARSLKVRRPGLIEPEALQREADRFLAAKPRFATFATCMLPVLGTWSGTLGHRFGHSLVTGRRRAKLFAEILETQSTMAGDGEHRVHCAELATRLYLAAGVPLVFSHPVLAPVLLSLAREHGRSDQEFIDHQVVFASGSPGRGERTAPEPVDVDLTEEPPGAEWTQAMDAVTRQRGPLGLRAPDRADFVLPGDYERARPFDDVGELRWSRRGRWTPTAPTAS